MQLETGIRQKIEVIDSSGNWTQVRSRRYTIDPRDYAKPKTCEENSVERQTSRLIRLKPNCHALKQLKRS